MTTKAAATEKNDAIVQKGYEAILRDKNDKQGLGKYEKYLKEHAARLRRLEREATGELVAGSWGTGEDE